MKAFFLCVFLSSNVSALFAQTDAITKTFLRQVIEKKKVMYRDHVSDYALADLTKAVSQLDKPSTFDKKRMTLTEAEYGYLKAELAKMKTYKWADDVFEKNNLLSMDTIETIFNTRGKGWPYFNNKFGDEFYSFTKPIFLRNNTICIVYTSRSCGELCGHGGAYIYIKINGRWGLESTLLSWIS